MGKHLFKLNIVTFYFLGCTAVKPLFIYTVMIKLCAKRLACDRKIMCGTIHSSNKKGHKNWGLLLKSMDYIIEWNAPAPVCASQASLWLFPGSIEFCDFITQRQAGLCSGYVLDWLHLLNGSHEMHSNTVIPLQKQNKIFVWHELDFYPEKKAISHSLSVCWLLRVWCSCVLDLWS